MVIHKGLPDEGIMCNHKGVEGEAIDLSETWDNVDCPSCLAMMDKFTREIQNSTGEKHSDIDGIREDYTLTELVTMYKELSKSKEFRYELGRLNLNFSEVVTLIEFLHCRCL